MKKSKETRPLINHHEITFQSNLDTFQLQQDKRNIKFHFNKISKTELQHRHNNQRNVQLEFRCI